MKETEYNALSLYSFDTSLTRITSLLISSGIARKFCMSGHNQGFNLVQFFSGFEFNSVFGSYRN